MQRDLVDRANFAPLSINWADGLFLFTPVFGKGQFLKLAGLRYSFLVVNQTPKASGEKTMPCQQTLKIGQMIPCKEETL